MIFKSKINLGLQVLHHLKAAADAGDILTVAQLAKKTDKSTSFIEPIMAVLKGMGLVDGFRGPGGGYVLAHVVGRDYTYRMVGIESFSFGFYPDEEHDDCIKGNFAMLRLSAVIG